MAKLVDAWDLKSPLVRACRFDSGFGHHLKSRVCGRKLMQTLVCFRSTNSFRWHRFLVLAIANISFGHHHADMSRLVSGLNDVTAGFRLSFTGCIDSRALAYDADLRSSCDKTGRMNERKLRLWNCRLRDRQHRYANQPLSLHDLPQDPCGGVCLHSGSSEKTLQVDSGACRAKGFRIISGEDPTLLLPLRIASRG